MCEAKPSLSGSGGMIMCKIRCGGAEWIGRLCALLVMRLPGVLLCGTLPSVPTHPAGALLLYATPTSDFRK